MSLVVILLGIDDLEYCVRSILRASCAPPTARARRRMNEARPASPDAATSVLLLEDDPKLGRRIARSLEQAGYRVHLFDSPGSLAALELPPRPCVCVLDMKLREGTGLDAMRMVRARRSGIPIVFASGASSVDEAIAGMKGGAIEFLLKPFRFEQLVAAIETGVRAERALLARDAKREAVLERLDRLSPREREVLDRMLAGMKTAEIASALGMAPGTAKIHRSRVLEKFWCGSVAELLAMIKDAGMLEVRLPT